MEQTHDVSAEIIAAAKIYAETELFKAEARKRDAEIKKLDAEITKMIEESKERMRDADLKHERHRVEMAKMASERAKIDRETAWYPLVAGAAFMGAAIAIVKFFFT